MPVQRARKPARRPRAKKRVVRRKAAPRPKAAARAPRAPSNMGIGSTLGATIGGLAGGPGGAALGRALGGGAESLIRWISGSGDYKVQSNTLLQTPMASASVDSLPKFLANSAGTRIAHREYIMDVVTSPTAGAFNLSAFPIQPALTFPWLSNLAQNFVEYQINGMIFEFKSTSGESLTSTNTALGTVIMTTQYNVTQPLFVNKQQMDQYEFTSSAKPSMSILHPVECARGQAPLSMLSTRNGPQAANTDLRLYDFGTFQIATQGMQGTSVNIGELWISYDITLFKPRLGSASDLADHYTSNGSGVSTTAYFGNPIPNVSSSSDLGTVLTNTTIQFPPSFTGNVLLIYRVSGNSTSNTSPMITASAGASQLFGIVGNSSVTGVGTSGVLWGNLIFYGTYSCVGGGLLTFSGAVFPTGINAFDMLITVLPSSLLS